MRTPFRTAAAAMLVSASVASAAPTPAGWIVDKAVSRVGFTGAMNGQAFDGAFRRWDAQIAFDPANLAASHVTAAIETGSAATGDSTRDESLPTADWFSAKVFPRATFVSRKITSTGPGRYLAQGDLTIRGASHPVALPFTLAITGSTAKMTGALPLDRSAFGVGQGQFKAGDTVALKVDVKIAITATRAH